MKQRVNFIFCLHNHQPVGNFESVFEKAYKNAYEPFLEIVERYPQIKLCIHYSGTLFEWLEKNRLEYLVRLRRLTEQGRIELLGGGFYEPIFTMIPHDDLQGQLELMNRYLLRNFGTVPRGVWIPERVWEPFLAKSLADANFSYTVLDDFHFKSTGLKDQELIGYFLTESEGRLFKIFPLKEDLRYSIPFKDPQWSIDYLASYTTADGKNLVVYADDGEKFGIWPGTHKHVYEDGWLEKFLRLLVKNSDWLRLMTFQEAEEELKPRGKIYLPAISYREMGEWAILTHSQSEFKALQEQIKNLGMFDTYKHFLPGGIWRNFLVKYPEANLLYARMLQVSEKLLKLDKNDPLYQQASIELYKAQCNCAYWHGIFGGIYLPHLRNHKYSCLISAEEIFDEKIPKPLLGYTIADFDLDQEEELLLFNKQISIYLSPHRGGHIFEIDFKPKRLNLTATLSRRPESYHHVLLKTRPPRTQESIKSIHELVLSKQEGLEKALVYDHLPRESLIERFYRGEKELGDLSTGAYVYNILKKEEFLSCFMKRETTIAQETILLEKTISLEKENPIFRISFNIKNLSPSRLKGIFTTELNFAMFNPESFYHMGDRENLGPVISPAIFNVEKIFGIYDRWHELDIELTFGTPCQILAYPVNTVSQSEEGFELICQGYALVPRWELSLAPKDSWATVITYYIK